MLCGNADVNGSQHWGAQYDSAKIPDGQCSGRIMKDPFIKVLTSRAFLSSVVALNSYYRAEKETKLSIVDGTAQSIIRRRPSREQAIDTAWAFAVNLFAQTAPKAWQMWEVHAVIWWGARHENPFSREGFLEKTTSMSRMMESLMGFWFVYCRAKSNNIQNVE